MRNFFRQITCMLAVGILLLPALQPLAKAQDAVVSYQSFYDNLTPYGQWVYDPNYGNVFVPNVEPGFRPYATEGHWAMTEYGNMWVSDAPWGWACYHYGRWTYNSYYGWIWIPGHEWAPAWVSWRSGGGYYGWAPMGPGYRPGGVYEYPENYWVFVGPEYLYHPHVYSYYEPRYSTVFIQRTTYINETYVDNGSHATYYYGPRREVIERESHHPVEVYRVSNASEPGVTRVGGNSVSVYRPAINRESANSARPANVVTATRPIGKPENYSGEHNPPAFRQEMQNQNPAVNNHGTGRPQQFTPQEHQQQPEPQQHREPMPQEHQQQPMPQQHPQPVQEEHRQQPMPQQREQPMPQEHQQQPAPQQHQRPMPQQQRPQPRRQAPAAPHEAKKR